MSSISTTLTILIIENIFIALYLTYRINKRRQWKIDQVRQLSEYSQEFNLKNNFKKMKNKKLDFKFRTLYEQPNLGIYHFFLKKINCHLHPQITSLLYIINGEARGFIGNKKIHAKPGDFILVPRGIPHHWETKNTLEYIDMATPSLKFTRMNDCEWL